MIRVEVDKADTTDLYEQVASEIRRAIADGEAKPGERLPPAKDLAAVLDVHTNTVLRALRLRAMKVCTSSDARGDLGRRYTRARRGPQQGPRARRTRAPPRLQRRRTVMAHRRCHLSQPRGRTLLCVVRGQAMRTRGVEPQGPLGLAHLRRCRRTRGRRPEGSNDISPGPLTASPVDLASAAKPCRSIAGAPSPDGAGS